MNTQIAVVILAAGLGKRMKSAKAKVLHEVLGRPMVVYVVETAVRIAGEAVVVVVGNQAEEVRRVVSRCGQVAFAHQEQQLGTGHAVMCALPHLPPASEHVVVLCGDVPLVSETTVNDLIADHLRGQCDVTLLAVRMEDPRGYGRILLDGRARLRGVVEEADATAAERAIKTINSGLYCVRRQFLQEALPRLSRDNAQGEFYLTDIIRIAYEGKRTLGVSYGTNPAEVLGINTVQDLSRAEALMAGRCVNIS